MTKTLLVFPRAARTRLICKWIETGNPSQPLACVWIDRATGATKAGQEVGQALNAESGRFRLLSGHLCA